MSEQQGSDIRDQAIAWHLRLQQGGDEDWQAFTRWLEADSRHDEAYDAVALLDAELGEIHAEAVARPAVANDDEPALPRGWQASRWGAMAAALIALVFAVSMIVPMLRQETGSYAIVTRPGETRVVTLKGAGRIALNGDTRIEVDRGDARRVTLARGEATFHVTHDEKDPFRVMVGGQELLDVGTIFNVTQDPGGLSVAVAEGAVMLNPQGDAMRLGAGDAVYLAKGSNVIERGKVPTASVGGWRSGRLDYRDAPVTRVAADLSRAIGRPVSVDPGVAAQRFTGTIVTSGPRADVVRRAQALLDVDMVQNGQGWRLTTHGGASDGQTRP